MNDVAVRVSVLVGVVGLGWAALARWERRRPRRAVLGLPPGLVVVVGDGCPLCPAAVRRLRQAGPGVTVIDGHDPRVRGLGIRSVPTALVVGSDGRPLLRRSGRSVLADADLLATEASRTEGT